MSHENQNPADCQPTNEAIYELIVATYQGRVLQYIRRFVGDPELSLDMLQDTFLAIYTTLANRPKFDGGQSPAEFLKSIQPLIYTIARNKCLDELRRRKNYHFVSFNRPLRTDDWREDFDPALEYRLSGPTSLESQVIMSDELKRAIQQIGRPRLLNLFLHLDGFSYKEIGQITGESMAVVKSKIFRCKQSLRQVLAD